MLEVVGVAVRGFLVLVPHVLGDLFVCWAGMMTRPGRWPSPPRQTDQPSFTRPGRAYAALVRPCTLRYHVGLTPVCCCWRCFVAGRGIRNCRCDVLLSYLPNRQTDLRGPVAQGQGTHASPPQPLTATVWIAHQPSGIPSLQLSFAAQRPNRLSSHPGPGLRLRSHSELSTAICEA